MVCTASLERLRVWYKNAWQLSRLVYPPRLSVGCPQVLSLSTMNSCLVDLPLTGEWLGSGYNPSFELGQLSRPSWLPKKVVNQKKKTLWIQRGTWKRKYMGNGNRLYSQVDILQTLRRCDSACASPSVDVHYFISVKLQAAFLEALF